MKAAHARLKSQSFRSKATMRSVSLEWDLSRVCRWIPIFFCQGRLWKRCRIWIDTLLLFSCTSGCFSWWRSKGVSVLRFFASLMCSLYLSLKRGSHIRRSIWGGKKTGNIVQDRYRRMARGNIDSGHYRRAVSWLFTTSYRGCVNRWFGEFLGLRAAADFEPSRPILCDLARRERSRKSSAVFNFLVELRWIVG